MRSFNEEFLKLEEERTTLKKLKSKISTLDVEINKTNESLEALKKILAKEKKDVDNLESFSLSYIYYKIKGSIDEKLSKEKLEFLEAQARYLEKEDYLNRLTSNKKQMLKAINDIGDIDLKYDDLLNSSAQYILKLNNENSEKVSLILNKIKIISLELKEIQEALLEGDNLIPYIDKAISNLNSAQNWGIYDMMGGDFIATMAKRSKMDDASKSINSIKVMLNRYNAELKDLSNEINVNLNLDSMSGIFDYLFDNFFTDYFVQGKINSALDSTKNLKAKVNNIQSNLTNKAQNYKKEIENLKKELENELKK
ncbi:MAG: hypothetical protein E6300_07680 [Clostridium sp.]|uniref:hypothetical protein n=1 Tax=Clostridium sp. TaxID=1506 RepID=UPI001EC36EB1|nr:hypothetical protein [Clostridium sp.]MBS5884859.1 hypothetical protein [Clostridium sp.]MDU7148354.1 hypothetical protein [Clostridium sp.]